MYVRTWAGSVIILSRKNFLVWLQGWIRWTLELRPSVPAHDNQPEEPTELQWPAPVRPWREGNRHLSEDDIPTDETEVPK